MHVPSRSQWLSLCLVVAGMFAVPLGLRALIPLIQSPTAAPSYIPSFETPRDRAPFDAEVVATLRETRPDYYVIGDSMAGTRIQPGHLSRLVGGRGVASLLYAGVGSAYWYLTFKNVIVEPGLRPRAVIFFFRDENMTDPLFRAYPGSLDRVAGDREPELDRILAAAANGTLYRLHTAVQSVYQYALLSRWVEPRIAAAPVPLSARRSNQKKLLERINNEVFTLDALRPMALADMQSASEAALDFDTHLPTSVLPEIVRLSTQSGIRVAFIRVQRRPVGNKPPAQSPALQRYVMRLRDYLVANGAYFHDDWGDPQQPLDIYEDGDHISRAYIRHYTEVFYRNNREIFR
ncbi:MAG: hypothetical protein NTY02_17685 [Acidobacteria bacterium]|nr:hypothetical protein [Acidobacteriota bacterium]